MKENVVTKKVCAIRSDIRGEVYLEALRMEAEGIDVLKLNTGNPAAFGYKTPESVRRALLEGLDEAAPYSDLKGMKKAREAILSYHETKGVKGCDLNDIFLTNGVSEGVQMATAALLEEGDEILLPCPNYSLWENCAVLAGATPKFYRCDEEKGWEPDLADLEEKISPRTKAILVINPNNPTGAVYSMDCLQRIARLAEQHDLILFADEIYDRLTFKDNPATAMASLSEKCLILSFNGLSKSHIICGYRAGWILLSGPEEKKSSVREALGRLAAMRLCSNTAAQLAIPAALADPMYTEEMLSPGGRIYEASRITCEGLDRIEGVRYVKNKASFYLFPRLERERFAIRDDRRFALDLLHAKHILIIPGSGFSHKGNDHFRIVMLPEEEKLKQAISDIGDFLSDYRQK